MIKVKPTPEDQQKLDNVEDYILINRYEHSAEKLAKRYPEGAPDHIIAQALGFNEEEIEPMYQRIIACLRHLVGVE